MGSSGTGTLSISGGGRVSSSGAYISRSFLRSAGVVSVDGPGSAWVINGPLYIGNTASGTLSITNGASVSATGDTWVGTNTGSSGLINFGANGGTLTTQTLYATPSQLAGTGTVAARGIVSDVNLTFDSTHPLQQTLAIQQPGRNIAVDLDLASNPATNGALGVGWKGSGSLTVRDGVKVVSTVGYLAYNAGSKAAARIDGVGSAWTSGGSLSVGYRGSGTLSLSGGAAVTAASASLYGSSLLAIDAGRGSSLTIGGSFTNNGTVRFSAGAGVPADGTKYSPIAASTWGGSGTFQAYGGTWDTASHTFTPSEIAVGESGSPLTVDRAFVQRMLVAGDGPSGADWQLGAGFLASSGSINTTLTATAADATILDGLKTAAGVDQSVLDAWTFSLANYRLLPGSPIYFSLNVGPNHSAHDLELWGYDGTSWAAYTPTDLTYDGTYASFTATGLSGYAVSAVVVPEPGTLAFLTVAFFGLLTCALRHLGRPRM